VDGWQNAQLGSTAQSTSVSQVAPPSTDTRTVLLSEAPPPSSTFHDRNTIVAGSGNGRVRA
jgi:hypothetical protein